MITAYDIVEKAAKTGKVDKGINEVTKAVERGTAKLVVVATDVSPKELTQHLPILAKEKGIKYVEVDSKQKLGLAVGISVSTGAVAVITPGEAKIDSLK
ncbi:ribosomal L7Ae/L30e/S12e/Gadd45 family protein [Candidatus Pacearchaeota archaeon]|nr:ribosomal L7Ae/L30e/S12e/Gadd45 family protein [Candidatus Pacearchaeota archaeon]